MNTRYPPEGRAGPAFSVQHLAEQLAREGTNPIVFCRTERPGLMRETLRGVEVVRAGTDVPVDRLLGALGQVIDHYRPTVVHTNLLMQLPAEPIARLVKNRGVGLVHTVREFSLLCPNELMRNGRTCAEQCPECRLATVSQREFAGLLDGVAGVSRYILDVHQRMGLFAATRVRRPIHNAYEPPARLSQPRPVGSPIRLGYLGRLDPMKGIELLLDTLSGALADRRWTLAVAGRGSIAGQGAPQYETTLVRRYPDPRIRFLGFVEPPALLANIDVLIVPSVWQEPFPRVTFEAYAHGVPVIGSSRGGIPEGIDDGHTGLLFEPDEPATLAEAIGSLLDDPARVAAMKAATLVKWEREFTPAEIVRQYRELYGAVRPARSPHSSGTSAAPHAANGPAIKAATILIATRNGAETLPRVFESYRHLETNGLPWKVVVVDNGSSDATAEVVARHARDLPLALLHEPRGGKNAALNRGLAEADGELLVFTDDDVIADPRWLAALRHAADRHPEFSIFGGAVRPLWPDEPPPLVSTVNVGAAFAITDPELPEGPVLPGLVWGPNMAIRRAVFETGLRFDEAIGPNGLDYPMGSETSFNRIAAAHGFRSWFVPGAIVYHVIRRQQLEPAWLLRRAFRSGRGEFFADLQRSLLADLRPVVGPDELLARLRARRAEVTNRRRSGDELGLFRARWELAVLRGYLHEVNRARRRQSRQPR